MSEPPSEVNPQILVSREQHDQEWVSSASLDEEEGGVAAEKETRARMQSVFQQVRAQIRSQVGTKAPKSSILELMQRMKDGEIKFAQVNSEPEEKKEAVVSTDESKDEVDLKQEELCAIFEKQLEVHKKALKDEFEVQIFQVRAEMQAYTDQALKDLECKMLQPHPKDQQGPDKKQKPSAPPPLVSRRGRVLTRTMTTITPKTCVPVIVGSRAKSGTPSSSKGESSRLLPRGPPLSQPGNKPCQSRKPVLPPAYPPLHQRKKTKAKTGN